MAGARVFSFGVLALIFASLFLVNSSPVSYDYYYDDNSNNMQNLNMSVICSLVPNGQLVADASNCNYYYSCNNGAANIQYCYNNYYFDKDSQQCLPQNQVVCAASDSTNACAGRTVGTWVSVAGNCNSYYYCSNSGPEQGSCPTGENFNPYAQACQYASVYPCTNYGTGDNTGIDYVNGTTINYCDFVENGIFFGSPTSCQGWNYCQNNVLITGNCPTGYIYSVSSSACVSSTATTCPQLSSDANFATNDPYYGGSCSSSSPTTKASNTCENYYQCNGANYILTTCPTNLYYDTVSSSCVNRLNARNNCDRCEGSSSTFVNTYSTTNCAGYTYCQNGVAQSYGTCPSGTFFNELIGACVSGTDPDFGCCNPTTYYGSSEESSTDTTDADATTDATTA